MDSRYRFGAADWLLLAVVTFWAFNYVVTKTVFDSGEIVPLAFLGLRFPIMTLLMLALWLGTDRRWTWRRQDWLPMVLVGAIGFPASSVLWTTGLAYTLISRSAILISTAPLFTALLAPRFGGNPLSQRGWTGVLLGVAGAGTLVSAGAHVANGHVPTLTGDLLSLGSAFVGGLCAAASRNLVRRYPVLRFTTFNILIGTVLISPLVLPPAAKVNWGQISGLTWACLVYSCLFAGIFSFWAWFYGIRRIGPARTMVYQSLVPVLSLVLAAMFMHDRPSPLQMVGGALAIVGVWLARSDPGRAPRALPAAAAALDEA